MDTLKVAWNQFLKNAEQTPGWAPLIVLVWGVLEWCGLPANVDVFHKNVPVSIELVAGVIAFALYWLGDALDQPIFKERSNGEIVTKKRFKNKYLKDSIQAQGNLNVGGHGLYSLATKLMKAAEKERGTVAINVLNESAKFLRSLMVPLLILSAYFFFRHDLALGVIAIAGSGLAYYCYPRLKAQHIRRLYAAAAALDRGTDKLKSVRLEDVSLIFWDGALVGAGFRAAEVSGQDAVQNHLSHGTAH